MLVITADVIFEILACLDIYYTGCLKKSWHFLIVCQIKKMSNIFGKCAYAWMADGLKPISIIINHRFIRPSAIITLGDFMLSQNGQPTLAQPNFHTLNKSGQCSPKHELFSGVIVSYDTVDDYVFIW